MPPSRRSRSLKRNNAKPSPEYQPLEPRQLLAADIGLGIEPQSGVLVERFNGIGGNNLTALTSHATYPNAPNVVSTSDNFASDRNVDNNFGLRMRGYITAPADGDYTFWVASDNQGSLLLSDSEDPAGATEIASVSGWTWRYQYYKYASQQSASITLAAGETYYIEGLMKEGGGGDSLTVAWSGPGIGTGSPVVIDESYLTVFDETNHAPQLVDDAFELLEDADEVTISPLVNDAPVHGSSLTVIGHSDVNNGLLVFNDDGTFAYTPTETFTGVDSFTYTVRNEIGATATATVNLNVEQTSGLLLERYNGIGGSPLSSLTNSDKFPLAPDVVGHVDNFEIPNNDANNYGVRLRGYLTAPETGEYTFWIAADDTGELWLSDDANSANAVKIAETTQWTSYRQWAKYESQQSLTISLVAGQDYYIEALMKERWGGDNLSVAWSGPGISDGTPVVIAGEFLTAHDRTSDVAPVTDLSVEFLSHSEALIDWTIPDGSPAVSYRVQASNDGGASFETVATTDTGATLALAVGLEEESDYLFRVVGSDSDSNANPVPAFVSGSTPESDASDESGFYQISLGNNGNWTRAEAGYSASGTFEAESDYVYADSIESAIRQAVTGSVLVTDFDDNSNEFVFGESEAFKIARFGDLSEADQQAAKDKFAQFFGLIPFSVSDDQWLILLEDSYGWKNIDSDHNDGYVAVNFEKDDSDIVSIEAIDDTAWEVPPHVDPEYTKDEATYRFSVQRQLEPDEQPQAVDVYFTISEGELDNTDGKASNSDWHSLVHYSVAGYQLVEGQDDEEEDSHENVYSITIPAAQDFIDVVIRTSNDHDYELDETLDFGIVDSYYPGSFSGHDESSEQVTEEYRIKDGDATVTIVDRTADIDIAGETDENTEDDPGQEIELNFDDDNGDGLRDFSDHGQIFMDDDLVELTFQSLIPDDMDFENDYFTLDFDYSLFRIWHNQDKSINTAPEFDSAEVLTSTQFDEADSSFSVWIEGVQSGADLIQLVWHEAEYVSQTTPISYVFDSALVKVKGFVDLDIDSDNNGYINTDKNTVRMTAEDKMEVSTPKPITYFGNDSPQPLANQYVPIRVKIDVNAFPEVEWFSFHFSGNLELSWTQNDNNKLTPAFSYPIDVLTAKLDANNEAKLWVRAIGADAKAVIHFIARDADKKELSRDTVSIAVQDGTKEFISDWVVPNDWLVNDASIKTPMPTAEAIGPQAEWTGLAYNAYNKGDAYTKESIGSDGFTLTLDVAFDKRRVDFDNSSGKEKHQFDENDLAQGEKLDARKMSGVANSGIKIGGIGQADKYEIAIIDVVKYVDLAGGIDEFSVEGAWKDSDTIDEEHFPEFNTGEALNTLMNGVEYRGEYDNMTHIDIAAGLTGWRKSYAILKSHYETMSALSSSFTLKVEYESNNLVVSAKKVGSPDSDYIVLYSENSVSGLTSSQAIVNITSNDHVSLQSHWGSGVTFSNIEFDN